MLDPLLQSELECSEQLSRLRGVVASVGKLSEQLLLIADLLHTLRDVTVGLFESRYHGGVRPA